jgi:hypothetical protein
LAAILGKMLAKEPGERFQTPGEVVQTLAGDVFVAAGERLPTALPVPITSKAPSSTSISGTQLWGASQVTPAERVTDTQGLAAVTGERSPATAAKKRWLRSVAAGGALLLAGLGLLLLLLLSGLRGPESHRAKTGNISKAKKPEILFEDDFQSGNLKRWRQPAKNSPYKLIARPNGKGIMLVGGDLPTAPVWEKLNPYRYNMALQCGDSRDSQWTDYAIEASVQFQSDHAAPGTHNGFLLMARMQPPDNFYWLEWWLNGNPGEGFDKPNLMIAKSIGGQQIPALRILYGTAPRPRLGEWHQVRFELQGRWLRAFIDGTKIAEAEDLSLKSGGAGLIQGVRSPGHEIFWGGVRVEELPSAEK